MAFFRSILRGGSTLNRILAGSLIIFVVCCFGICVGSEKQGAESEPTKSQGSGEAKRVKKKVGPFNIGKNRVAVTLDITERKGFAPSYNAYEIKNEEGMSYYKERLGPGTEIEGVFKLEGKSGEGIIFFFDSEPNAPPAGKSFQVFGMEKGRMKPLSGPIDVYGTFEQLPAGESKDAEKLFDGDVIKVDIWTGLIGVKVPLVVDFQKLTITPLKEEGIFDIYFLATPHQPVALPNYFYRDHNIKAQVERINETEGTNVEFLNAYASVQLKKTEL